MRDASNIELSEKLGKISTAKKYLDKYVENNPLPFNRFEKKKHELKTIKKAIDKFVKESGQAFELNLCGNNPDAHELFDFNSHFESSELFLNECHNAVVKRIKDEQGIDYTGKSQGDKAPQDNIDKISRKTNEAKDYSEKTFFGRHLQINTGSKRLVYLTLKDDLRTSLVYNDKKKINELFNLLTDEIEFEKYFYRNFKYYGSKIQLAKLNPIEESKFKESKKNKIEAIHNFIAHTHPKVISLMKDKKIYQYVCKFNNDKIYNDMMTYEINSRLGLKTTPPNIPPTQSEIDNGLGWLLSIKFNDAITLYDYTEDNLITDDDIYNVYDLRHGIQTETGDIKSIKIPYEKMIPKTK